MRSSVLVIPWLLVPLARAEGASFRPLGDLSGGEFYSEARDVSADGSAVVGASGGAEGYREAFRWTEAGGMQGLGTLPGGSFYSAALAVSGDGSVVVGYSDSTSGGEAFRWTQAEGMDGLGNLQGASFPSRAMGVSSDGSVVVGAANWSGGGGPLPVTGEAFQWTPSQGMQGLGDVPGGNGCSRAFGASADGSVIVGKGNAGSSFQVEDLGVAFRWTAGEGMVSLGFLPGGSDLSAATSVSADGSVAVGYSNTAAGDEAFRWTSGGGMVSLGVLPKSGAWGHSMASDVSADGSMVVGRSSSASGDKAFIWDAVRGMRDLQDVLSSDFDLDLAGWTLVEATGISADGNTIVGWGQNPSGDVEAWRAHVCPTERLSVPDPPGGVGSISRAFALTGGARWLSVDMTYSSGGELAVGVISAEDLEPAAAASLKDYMAVGAFPQIWDVGFEGDLAEATLVFHYDANALTDIDESSLAIWHFTRGSWVMGGAVDEEANTVSLTLDELSAFSLGVVPEPSTLVLLTMAALVLLACTCSKRCRQ